MLHFYSKSHQILNLSTCFPWNILGLRSDASDIQVSTHPLAEAESCALRNETSPIQIRLVVWEEMLNSAVWALHLY